MRFTKTKLQKIRCVPLVYPFNNDQQLRTNIRPAPTQASHVKNDENVTKVRTTLTPDRRVTTEQLANETVISSGWILSIPKYVTNAPKNGRIRLDLQNAGLLIGGTGGGG
jgi:hypothetical protein